MNEHTSIPEDSTIDQLTGLYNLEAFDDELNHTYRQGINNDLILVSIDINGLKEINDIYGLPQGNEAIKIAARYASETLKRYGKIFTVGGGEFIALPDRPCPDSIPYNIQYVISD